MAARKTTKARPKLPKRGINKLPKRKKPNPEDEPVHIKFGKRTIGALRPPKVKPYYVKRDTETPHLCIRVTPTAKSFFWEKTINRVQKRVNIGRFPEISIEQARNLADDIAADYVKGIDVQASRAAARDEMTLGDLWLDYREHRPRKREGEYSPTLEKLWKRTFKKWEKKQLSEVTFDRARRMILEIRKHAPIGANRTHRLGQAMFNYAKRELRWKGDNPFDFGLVSEKGRARKKRLRKQEMPQFMQGLNACSEDMRLLFLSSLFTGRRVGEVKAMRWEDVDLENGIWTVSKTKVGEEQKATLPSQLVEMLSQRKENVDDKAIWVFPSPSKSGHVEEIKKAWELVCEASGLQHLQARDLRRTLASWAQDEKVPIAVMSSQLGHANISTTFKHYTNIDPTVQRIALDVTVASMLEAAK
jgi:integrase